MKDGRITKPLVAWCIGTCARMFTSEVQFGHAGACANSDRETATAKNQSLAEVGAYVPDTFDNLGKTVQLVLLNTIINIYCCFDYHMILKKLLVDKCFAHWL